MSTNYYVRTGFGCNTTIIGRASAGWKFLHAVDPTWPRDAIRDAWLGFAASGKIEDEYGVRLSLSSLLSFIEVRQSGSDAFDVDLEVFTDSDGYEFIKRGLLE